VTNLSASGNAFLGSAIVPLGNEVTIMRTRGILDVLLKGVGGSDGDGYFGAVGIGVVPETAFAAGITAIPAPLTQLDWDGWLWHQFFSVHDSDITRDPSPSVHFRTEVDSKAMRKLDRAQTLVAVTEVVEIGVAEVDIFFETRCLFQDSGR